MGIPLADAPASGTAKDLLTAIDGVRKVLVALSEYWDADVLETLEVLSPDNRVCCFSL